jgi:hypothetical protein
MSLHPQCGTHNVYDRSGNDLSVAESAARAGAQF